MSFANGTKRALARVDGDKAWTDLMANLALEDQLSALSISSGVSLMTQMLRDLRKNAEMEFKQPIAAGSLTMAERVSVSRWGTPVGDMVKQAFLKVGLEYTEIVHYSSLGEPLLYPENSITAATDEGLCHPYTSSPSCVEDENGHEKLPWQSYYLLGYYSHALEVTTTADTLIAYTMWPYPYVDYHLGAEVRDRKPDAPYYWEAVRQHLSLPLANFPHRKPNKVFLYGDRVRDERLNQTLEGVLRAFLGDDEMPEWVDVGLDPAFAGAMGAAEFALRQPYWNADEGRVLEYREQHVLQSE